MARKSEVGYVIHTQVSCGKTVGFRLWIKPDLQQPKDKYFVLHQEFTNDPDGENENYAAQFSFLLAAMTHGLPIIVYGKEDIDSGTDVRVDTLEQAFSVAPPTNLQ